MTELSFDNPAVIALDVTIGLAVMYLGLSIIASATLEVIANFRRSRATYLRLALERMLDNAGDSEAIVAQSGMSDKVLSHPLVATLSRPIGPFGQLVHAKNGPAYLSSERFVEALLDVLRVDSGRKNIDAAINALPDNKLQTALKALRTQSSNDAEFVLRLRSWYDELMARAAGWYKRSAQVALFVIGLGLAVALNVDTLQYSARLACDGVFRALLVDEAGKIAKSDMPPSTGISSLVVGDKKTPFMPAPNAADGARPICPSIFTGALNATGPTCVTGASHAKVSKACEPASDERSLNNFLGWLLTAFAISLGAPYWLRLLSMLVALRSSLPIRKPEPPPPAALPADSTGRGPAGPANGSGDSGTAVAGTPTDDTEKIEDVQMVLGLRGTEISGKLDSRTREAIKVWQRKYDMRETGNLTSEMYDFILRIPSSAMPRFT